MRWLVFSAWGFSTIYDSNLKAGDMKGCVSFTDYPFATVGLLLAAIPRTTAKVETPDPPLAESVNPAQHSQESCN